MNDLLVLAAQNTLVALALAMVVYGITRVWRNPPVAHVLWLVVLLKLVAPPVLHVDWSALVPESTHAVGPTTADTSRIDGQPASSEPRFVDPSLARTTAQTQAAAAQTHDFVARVAPLWAGARPVLLWLWLGGAAIGALVAAMRIVRFERSLQETLPASERLQRLALEVAARLGVRRVPRVRYAEGVEVPLVWWAGRRATIVLPMRLLSRLDDWQTATVLAHELAHLRRRDHWVRAVELVVSTLYWWNPLVWLVRRQIHRTEDLCCDAWVRWAFPDCTKQYAAVMLQTAELLTASRGAAPLLPASPFLHSHSLKARIEMLLENRFAPRASRKALFAVALVALLVLPSFATAETKADPGSKEAASPDSASIVRLQALQAKVMLAKENLEKARESERFTDRLHGKGYVTTVQRDAQKRVVQRAMLELQMAETALAMLEDQLKKRPGGKPDKPARPVTSEFPYAVKFEQGAIRFDGGDQITIEEVRGTAETFAPGNIYWIRGTYKLASHDKAILLASVTVTDRLLVLGRLGIHERVWRADHRVTGETAKGDPGHVTGIEFKVQRQPVHRGKGTFTLFLPMYTEGMPHVSFYPADGGEGFGGNYFGTGESVLKKWWGEKEED